MIPYGRQDIQDTDIDSVLEVLKSDFLTQGPVVPRFEASIAEKCGANFSVALNSATAALHVALLSLGVGSEDTVWTSPNTFVSSANAALYCGAKVDFVDIDRETYNMSVSHLSEKLSVAQKVGQVPKVVIAVHLSGQSCDMKAIFDLAQKYGFKIVEDASHALGGSYLGQPVGSCAFSDITVFSFHPVKIITTGEGGMAVTNQSDLAQKMALYRSHGITRDDSLMTQTAHGPWHYEQIALGYNYRMTDIQAALGLSQIQRLSEYIEARHAIAGRYNKQLSGLPLTLPKQPDFSYSAYHLYIVRLHLQEIKPLTHLDVFNAMRNHGIKVNLHYIPVHTQPYYKNLGFEWGDFPNAEEYYRTAISLPIFPKLKEKEQKLVCKVLNKVLQK